MHKKFGKSLEDKFHFDDLDAFSLSFSPSLPHSSPPPILFYNLSLVPFLPSLSPLTVTSYSCYYLHLFFLGSKRAK